MAQLKMLLDGERYTVDPDKLTLGEAFLLKTKFNMEDFASFNFFDPEQMIGLFFIAVHRVHPEMDEAEILKKVEGLENGPIFKEINKQVEDAIKKAEAEKADPPKAAASASAPVAKRGRSGTTPKKRGVPS